MSDESRPEFREWVDGLERPEWPDLPLTHTAKSLIAKDIVRTGEIRPTQCGVFNRDLSYFFYGRPAYRVHGDGPIKQNAACPVCFLMKPAVASGAEFIFPFDTGAFDKRLYKHAMIDEIGLHDYSLEGDNRRINPLIKRTYGNLNVYFDLDIRRADQNNFIADPDEYLAQSYLDLVSSRGRNEPDDRVGTIEIAFSQPVCLDDNLAAVVVPDNIWSDRYTAEWLKQLSDQGIDIIPYHYTFAQEPSHYRALIETEIRKYYLQKGYL